MGEIYNMLTEKPGKVKKAIILLLHIIITVLLACFAYTRIIGAFNVILPGDDKLWEKLKDYVLGGEILLAAVFFQTVYVICFKVLARLHEIVFHFIASSAFRSYNINVKNKFQFTLILYKALSKNKETGRVEPGVNFDTGYAILSFFQKKKNKDKIRQERKEYMDDIVFTFLMLILTLKFFVPLILPGFLFWVMIALYAITILNYIMLTGIISLVDKAGYEIFGQFRFLRMELETDRFLSETSIDFVRRDNWDEMQFIRLASYESGNIVLVYNGGVMPVSSIWAKQYVQLATEEEQRRLILIHTTPLSKAASAFLDESSINKTIVNISSRKKLATFFRKEIFDA